MKKVLGIIVLVLIMTSCNGIFSGLYDVVETASLPFGFKEISENGDSGTIFIDARDYEKWTYINLKDKIVDTANMVNGDDEPRKWDFAMHRYDVKTNNGSARQTDFISFDELTAAGNYDEGVFTSDTLGKVIVDMSDMMNGNIIYHESNVNKVLSRWLKVDTSIMPPIYTMSGKVYLLRFDDGTMAALLFTDFMNESSVKGYITIRYMYPL